MQLRLDLVAGMSVEPRARQDRALLRRLAARELRRSELLFELLVQGRLVLHNLPGGPDNIETLRRVRSGLCRRRHAAVDVLVDRPPRRIPQILLVVKDKGCLGHGKHDQVRPGINGPSGARQTSPTVLAGARALILLRMLRLDLPQATVANPWFVEDEDSLLPVTGSWNMVADHLLDRLLFQDTDSVELAEIPDHEEKAEVIVESAHHAAFDLEGHLHGPAAGEHFGGAVADPAALLAALVDDLQGVRQVRLAIDLCALVPSTEAVCLLLRHPESGVAHFQRPADALLDDDIEGFLGNHLQNPPEDVQAVAVIPEVARLPLQGDLGQEVAPLLEVVQGAVPGLFAQLLVDFVVRPLAGRPWVAESRAVADAAGVRYQLPQRNRPLDRLVFLLPPFRQHTHRRLRKSRDVLRNRVVQVDALSGVLEVCHERGRNKALGHGEQPYESVARHFYLGLYARKASILVVHQHAIPDDATSDAREVPHACAPLEVLGEPLEGRPVHAHGLGGAQRPLRR
mmetsp:Transcript_65734/g.189518  ORF Transcript_65734/g.189518 Transcript_65734/m.189518 type:complete len:513 (-) Transcript_65734:523-2061(-)